jgi:carboxymethylenebutenolidase
MTELNLFQRYLAEEFAEDFVEGRLSRRAALKLIGSVTGSVVLAEGILSACAPLEGTAPDGLAGPTASAQPPAVTVGAEDPGIVAGPAEFPSQDGTLHGYLARPEVGGPSAVVMVCHENRGLTEHIRDVTRRLAKAGYVALAVDLLSRVGGTGAVAPDDVPGILGGIDPETFVADFQHGLRYLKTQAFADTPRLGMVGFCFGGGVTWRVATRWPDLRAAVPFYGPHPPVSDVASIQAAVLAIYAGRDDRINQGIPAIEAAMLANGRTYQKVIYPDTDHAFHNDTGTRYNPAAAQDAWRRTLEWFGVYLRIVNSE